MVNIQFSLLVYTADYQTCDGQLNGTTIVKALLCTTRYILRSKQDPPVLRNDFEKLGWNFLLLWKLIGALQLCHISGSLTDQVIKKPKLFSTIYTLQSRNRSNRFRDNSCEIFLSKKRKRFGRFPSQAYQRSPWILDDQGKPVICRRISTLTLGKSKNTKHGETKISLLM